MAKKCRHPSYNVVDGKLVCSVCGEPSPRAELVDGRFIPVSGDKTTEKDSETKNEKPPADDQTEGKTDDAHEDKMMRKSATKNR